jgi:hypothetical protein
LNSLGRHISALKTLTKISRLDRSGSASRQSTTSCGRYREEVIRKRKAAEEIEAQLAALEVELRGQNASDALQFSIQQSELEPQSMAAD